MTKVKIFSAFDRQDLETQINDFLNPTPRVAVPELIDIKFVPVLNHAWNAMVIYE